MPRRHNKAAWKKRKFKGQRRTPEFDGKGLLSKLRKERGDSVAAPRSRKET